MPFDNFSIFYLILLVLFINLLFRINQKTKAARARTTPTVYSTSIRRRQPTSLVPTFGRTPCIHYLTQGCDFISRIPRSLFRSQHPCRVALDLFCIWIRGVKIRTNDFLSVLFFTNVQSTFG